MTINWKSRATVFRLLVAVYVELGEAAFKGRYGRIAELYGADATYDAVKSFFAKEVTRAANDFRRDGEGRNRIRSTYAQRQQNRTLTRRLHLDFDEADLSIVAERPTDDCQRRPLQAPAKRSRLYDVSQPIDIEIEPSYNPNANNMSSPRPVENSESVPSSIQSTDERIVSAPQASSANCSNVPLQSTTYRASQARRTNNKRPYSVIEDPINTHRAATPPSALMSGALKESFGYITNQGRYRCALCFSQVTSRAALEQHETRSELHLRNLRNPQVIFNGRARLAQATIPENTRPQTNGNTHTPFRLGGFVEGEPSNTNINNIPIDPRLLRNPTTDLDNAAPAMNEPGSTNHPPRTSASMDTERTFSSATSNPLPPVNTSIDKGKQRAASISYPPTHHPYITAPEAREPRPPPPPNLHKALPSPPICHLSNAAPSAHPQLTPAERAEILRTTGIKLAEKCIERHPDLIAQFHGRVLREAEAAAAMASLRNCGRADSTCNEVEKTMKEDVIVID